MFKSDILFTGFYGKKNVGDDAFVEIASWGSKKYWNKRNIRFLAIQKNLPLTLDKVKGFPLSLQSSYRFQQHLLINNSDYLISAGGSTIHSGLEKYNPKAVAMKRKNSGGRIKLGGIGVSVGPFLSAKDEVAVQDYLRSIDFLALRDKRSYDYVNSLDLPYKPVRAFDLAALLPDIYKTDKKKSNNDKNIIGVSVCPVESVQNNMDINHEIRRNSMIVELLKEIDKYADVQFNFFVINGNEKYGDKYLTEETIAKASPRKYKIINYSPSPKHVWDSIGQCDFMISTRLHAAMFACFSGVPFILNEYHQKCSDFLGDIGYDEKYKIYNSDYDVKTVAVNILNQINGGGDFVFPRQISEMRKMAEFNFTKIQL